MQQNIVGNEDDEGGKYIIMLDSDDDYVLDAINEDSNDKSENENKK